MTPLALQSWQAHVRALSDNALQVLLRGLRSGDERIEPQPIVYGLIYGDGLDADAAMIQATRIGRQAALLQRQPIYGEPGGLLEATHWLCWWFAPENVECRYQVLAVEVLLELDRRERGGTQVRVC